MTVTSASSRTDLAGRARHALWHLVERLLAAEPRQRKERRMTEYLVTWQIFVEARTPEAAALGALAAQRNVDSAATCFDVRDEAGRRNTVVCPTGEDAMDLEEAPPVRRHLTLVKTSRA
jgi:hypothetical protein